MFIFSSCDVHTEMNGLWGRSGVHCCRSALLNVHLASSLSWVFIYRDRVLFYFYFLLLISKLQIKLLRLDFFLRPLLSLGASDAETRESSMSPVLTFTKGTVVPLLKIK